MSGHHIKFTIERWDIYGDVTCDEPDNADCRFTCSDECEEWGPLIREGGKVFHTFEDDYGSEGRHEMRTCDCIVLDWIEGGEIAQYYTGPKSSVHDGPIEVEWNGDGFDWHYAGDPS